MNPLFEVFDGGDFILSSYRDIEADKAEMSIYFERAEEVGAAKAALANALGVVGVVAEISACEIPDEDWKFAYRRHFKTEAIGRRLMTVPVWELEHLANPEGRELLVLDPGMAFGTGKHETTRACLEFIEVCAEDPGSCGSFLDMGCGSGILSIAACKLGYARVAGFDVDPEAVAASRENADQNGVRAEFCRFALGRAKGGEPVEGIVGVRFDLVAANILGPLLIRFADEIVTFVGHRLIVSGILTELYPEVLSAYVRRGFRELSRKTIGEWTTGLLERA